MELGAIWINIILSGQVSMVFEMEHPDYMWLLEF